MEVVERQGSGPGRPPIGPKVQTHAPDEIAAYIRAEAKRRKVRRSVVARELLVAGYAAVA